MCENGAGGCVGGVYSAGNTTVAGQRVVKCVAGVRGGRGGVLRGNTGSIGYWEFRIRAVMASSSFGGGGGLVGMG